MLLKPALRRWVVATCFPPFLQLYRAIYRLLIRLAVRRFTRFPGTRAVYLTRGLACQESIPGVSDIDLTVIGDWDPQTEQRLRESFRRLASIFPLYDRNVGIYTLNDFQERYQTDPFCQFRFAQGRRTWKLLTGHDYLSELPPQSPRKAFAGSHMEIRVWWSHFAHWAFRASPLDADKIFLNSLCYKAVGEVLRVDAALTRQSALLSRRQAIEEAAGRLAGASSGYLHKLSASAAHRHLRYQGAILEDTRGFLLSHLDELYRQLESHPGLESIRDVRQVLDDPREEWFCSEAEDRHVQELVSHVRKAWAGRYCAAYLVGGLPFAMDELVLMFEVQPDRPPTVGQLRELNRLHAQAPLRRRVNLFLLLPNMACQVDVFNLPKGFQAILAPRLNPDVFIMLACPERCIDGPNRRPAPTPAWTEPVEDFLDQERRLFSQALDNPVIYKANTLEFLRMFWKCLQLAVIRRSAPTGEVTYPVTLPAVTRALNKCAIPAAPFLADFAQAYQRELDGFPADIGMLVPAAVSYLKPLMSETDELGEAAPGTAIVNPLSPGCGHSEGMRHPLA